MNITNRDIFIYVIVENISFHDNNIVVLEFVV